MTETVSTEPRTRAPGLLTVVGKLIRTDIRLIGRDSFLPGIALFSVGVAVLLRLALPWLVDQVKANPGIAVDVEALVPLLVGYLVVFEGATLGGMMIAFILLDERDDHTIDALLVTPVPTTYYIGYRILVAIAIAFAMVLVEMFIVGQAMIPLWQLLPVVAVASLMGAFSELFLVSFANNKVEGFAQLKVISTLGLLVLAAWFLPMPWQLLVGLFPPYWAVKAYWLAQAGDPNWGLALLVGAALMVGSLTYLTRRFTAVVYG